MLAKDKKKQGQKAIDATVIDEGLLMYSLMQQSKAVKDYLHEQKILQRESINLANIRQLSLSFQNIWKIQYLQCLDKLEKLQLDNNIIEKIENLGHLTNLKWLDLSFNNISRIEGLDNLVNLTDLSLYNNRISVLEGLEKCTKLNVFSIGNNDIRTFEEFQNYFGKGPQKKIKFKYLQVLNVYGNKFTKKEGVKDTEYENHLISHLPNLRYLDYVFIDDQRRRAIKEDDKFKTEDQAKYLIDLKVEQATEKQFQQQKRKKQASKMHLLDNYADDLVQDQQLEKIKKMRGIEEEVAKFSSKVKEIVENIQKKIKEMNEQKLKSVHKFELGVKQREAESEAQTILAIESFEKEKKSVMKQIELKQIQNKHDHSFAKEWVKKLKEKCDVLSDKLLAIEIQLAEDVDNSLRSFLNILGEHSRGMELFLTGETGHFKKIDEEMKEYSGKLEKITKEEIEVYTKMQNNAGENDEPYSSDPDLNLLLDNTGSIGTIVTSIKEKLLEKKTRVEGQVVHELCLNEVPNYTKLFNQRQYERNRKNVNNIKSKVAALHRLIDGMVVEEEQNDA